MHVQAYLLLVHLSITKQILSPRYKKTKEMALMQLYLAHLLEKIRGDVGYNLVASTGE